MLITPRRCPATSLLSCDFSNQEKSAAATLRTPAAAVSERSRPYNSTATELAADNQGLGNTFDQQERTLVSSLSG